LGGIGGGGTGGLNANGVSGNTNTGGGGGGSNNGPSTGLWVGGTGGSGVVIISYPATFAPAEVTGEPTVATSGGNRIYTFTGTGSIKWNQ
jgi:hypothetical protein